jgi:hypothetical protein
MENAKDTFYVTLRNRLATLNPNRVIILRGVQRPGILAEEAEAVVPQMPSDAFVLRWTDLQADLELPSILTRMTCEIHYTTGGTKTNGGLDRGRGMSEMDAELLSILTPYCAQKMSFSQMPATAMETRVFWSVPQFGAVATSRERVTRIAEVTVFAFQEQREL